MTHHISVVETQSWIAKSKKIFSEEEQFKIITFIAENPTVGDLIPDTGGVRKLRWGVEGRGKRGGARIIYYYHSPLMPIHLITAFAKNEQSDLTPADRSALRPLVDELVHAWGLA